MAAQGHDHDGAIAVEVSAFVKDFVGLRVELQGWRARLGEHCGVRREDVAFGLCLRIVREEQFFAGHQDRQARQVRQSASMVQMNVRKNRPAQLGGIFAGTAEHFWKRDRRIQLSRERLQFPTQPERVDANLLAEMARVAGVDQQVACGVFHQDASGGHADGEAAERFTGFDPAGRQAGQPGNGGNGAAMRWRRRKRSAAEVEQIKRSRADGDENEKQQDQALEEAKHRVASPFGGNRASCVGLCYLF